MFYIYKYFTWSEAPSSVVENLYKQYSSSLYLTIRGDLITACTGFCNTEIELVYEGATVKLSPYLLC
jgi:hypothetical protein